MRSENSQGAVLLGVAGSILKQVHSEVLECGGTEQRVRSRGPEAGRRETPADACHTPLVALGHGAHCHV